MYRGEKPEHVRLCDLPAEVRLAYLRREPAGFGREPGAYDDAAHARYLAASPAARERAERRAEMVRLLRTLEGHTRWPERLRLIRERFGEKAPSKVTLKR
mgnify:FL=1